MSALEQELDAAFGQTPEPQAEPQAPETPEAPAPPERQRDESGRFVAAAQEEPQPEAETPQEQAERVYAGKFRSVEDLERGKVAADEHIQRLEGELRELRQALTPQPQAPQPGDIDAMEEPQLVYTAVQAARGGDEFTYQRAWTALNDVNPYAAADLHARRIAYESQQQLMPSIQRSEEQIRANRIGQAYAEITAAYPDAGQLTQQMLDLIQERPALITMLRDTDPKTALETAYAVAKLRASGQGTPPPQETQPDHLAARLQATVAQGTSNPPLDQSRAGADAERDAFYELFDQEMGRYSG